MRGYYDPKLGPFVQYRSPQTLNKLCRGSHHQLVGAEFAKSGGVMIPQAPGPRAASWKDHLSGAALAMAATLWRTVAKVCSGATYGHLPGAVAVMKLCELCELHLYLWFFTGRLFDVWQFGQNIYSNALGVVPA